MALGINIVSAFDGRGLEKAVKEFNKLKTTSDKAQFAIQKAALPAAAALAGLGFAAVKATQAAMQESQEMANLAATLQRVTGASTETINANEQFLASLQRATIYSDSEMRPALASLVQGSGDLARSQKDLQLAMDIATATGVPLVQVADSLSKAYNDNFKSLKALSPALNDNIKEGQSLDQIFQELNATFGGATAAATDTAAGRMKQLQNQMNDLQESIGSALLPIVERIVPLFSSLADAIQENQTIFLIAVGAIAAFSAAIVAASVAIRIHTTYQNLMKIEVLKNSAAMQGAGAAASSFASAMAGLLIGEVIVGILNNVTGAAKNQKKAFEDTTIAVDEFKNGTGDAKTAWLEFSGAVKNEVTRLRSPIEVLKDNLKFKNFGKEFEIGAGGLFGNLKADIESVDKVFQGFLDTNIETAAGIVDAMKAQLAQTEPNTREYSDLAAMIARYEAMVIRARAATDAQTNALAATNNQLKTTKSLLDVVFEAQLRSTLGVYDDLRMRNANNETLKKFNGTLSSGAGTVQTAKEKLEAFTSALRKNYDAQRSLTDAQRQRVAANKALDQAVATTAKAQDYFNKVTRGFPRDSKEAIAATDRYADAQKRLRDAQRSVQDATLSQQKAEQELIRLRAITANPEDVAEAERNLERSKYAVEEANFAVTDAEQKLAELRANPEASATEIRRAEIDLAEAKLAVKDSVQRVQEAEATLAKEVNRKATAEEIAEAERDLMRAKTEVLDATEEVKDATKDEADAQTVLNQVLNGATQETDAYKDALKELTDAKDDEEEARRRVADAILNEANATLSLRDAIAELNAVKAKTPAGIVAQGTAALAGISTDNPALDILNQTNGGTQPTTIINNNINAGMGTDGDVVARQIIDVLKSYERANGYVPIVAEYSAYV
jgi:hypothetical protein